jgi:hypothetical protein
MIYMYTLFQIYYNSRAGGRLERSLGFHKHCVRIHRLIRPVRWDRSSETIGYSGFQWEHLILQMRVACLQ